MAVATRGQHNCRAELVQAGCTKHRAFNMGLQEQAAFQLKWGGSLGPECIAGSDDRGGEPSTCWDLVPAAGLSVAEM